METKQLLFGLIGFFLGGLLVSVAATTFDAPSPTTSMSQMTEELNSKQGDDFDKAFISNMIEHHQAAVDMAELSEDRAKHEEIKTMSSQIISTQQAEIDQMESWQKAWGYETTQSSHEDH